jgi:TolB-like protein/tetratricopeptide (TPR) repeat protein
VSRPNIPESGATSGPEGLPLPGKKLDSWGEIASYFQREIRTVQRWEKDEGLPIHRHEHKKKSTVYAYTSELDNWFKRRQPEDDPEADAAFVAEAEVDTPQGKANDDSTLADDKPADPIVDEPTNRMTRLGRWLGVAAIGSALLFVMSSKLYHRYQAGPVQQESVRLVVLPFVNLSGDPKQGYLSAGLTDVITTQLGRLDPQHLRVIAPTSASVMSGKPISEIRQALNVQYVLEGSVQRVANQIRIDVRLIQASDEAQAGSDSFTRDLSDFLQVESEVSEAIAGRIVSTLPGASSAAAVQGKPHLGVVVPAEAASKSSDAFLKAEILWTNRGDLKQSIALFEEAIQQNPNYAQAYAGLANATAIVGQVPNDGMSPQEAKPRAREAAQHALALDPRLAEAHAVLGNVAMSYDWDFATAEKELKTAIEMNPNYPFAHEWYAHLLMAEGRYEEALAESHHLLELEPATPLFHAVRVETLYYARKYDEAIEEAQGVVKDNPNFALAYYWLGCAYREKKMYPEAIATFERARKLTADLPFMVMAYGHAQALAGNAGEARKTLRLLIQMQQTRPVPDIYLAAIHVGLGEKDEAFRLLSNDYQKRVDRLIYLRVEPMADPLRSDPRFTQLIAKIGPH